MRGMRAAPARWFVAVVLAFGAEAVVAPPAGATPHVCGQIIVTVDDEPHEVPYIEPCDPPAPPCGGPFVNLGHHDLGLVVVDGYLCVRNL